MKIRTIIVLFLTFMCISNQSFVRGDDKEVKIKTAIQVKCGDIVESEFTSNYEDHPYIITLNPGDILRVSNVPLGDQLQTALELRGPTGLAIAVSDVNSQIRSDGTYSYALPAKRPSLTSGKLSATGEYTVTAWNYSWSGYRATDSGGVGVYTIYFGCTLRDGTAINPGDTTAATDSNSSNNNAPVVPAFSGSGFPGLAPVDFTNAFTNDLTLGQPAKSKIPPSGDAVLGYTFDAKANDNLSLSFTRASGNLNLGLVVLSADNKVVFQASLVTSSELTTKFTLPSDGTYTIGIFRIDLLPPASPEATAFQLTATLNP